MALPSIQELASRAENLKTWEPQKGFQTKFFKCPATLILGGGAAGAGKTDAGLIWAAQDYDKPGYRATIFRRSYPELERHIIPRSHALFKDVGRYNSTSHAWTFRTANGGESRVEFAFLESEGDVYNHQGVPNARYVYDESTRFSESMVRNLQAWQRTEAQDVQCQTALLTNPIGPGFAWHHAMFIKGRRACRIYDDTVWYSDGKPTGLTTCFIPGLYTENKINLERNPDYERNLDSLPDILRNALKFGSWAQNVGVALDFDAAVHTCEPFEIPEFCPRWMAIDWGKDDIACCIWFAYYNNRVYVYRTFKRPGLRIIPYAYECMEKSRKRNDKGEWERETVMFAVLSHDCFGDKGTERKQSDEFADIFSKHDIPLTKSDKDAQGRTMLIREYFRTAALSGVEARRDLDYGYWVKKFQAEGDAAFREYRECMNRVTESPLPKCLIFRDDGANGNGYLIDSLPHLVTDTEHGKNKTLAPRQDDHGWDALGYGLRVAPLVAANDINDIYLKLLEGRIPESTGEVARTMQQARDIAAEFDTFKPVEWRR